LQAHRTRGDAIHLSRQGRKINVRLDVWQGIAQPVDLLLAVPGDERVGLDGTVGLHDDAQNVSRTIIVASRPTSEFFEVPS